ncbi:MAG: hypothetical protein QOG42_1781, partial [Solirubrobacteraceae bacterium]|nr:hypothetical protein [Solirubrobacteraceae bacterium]
PPPGRALGPAASDAMRSANVARLLDGVSRAVAA